jgi:hypothetical protein
MSKIHVSLIQSDFGRSQHGNFEAVIVQGTQLWRWFRDNSRNDFGPWARGSRITGDHDTVAGANCLIQSDYRTGPHGNFEVVVPLRLNNGAIELRHFYRDNNNDRLPWIRLDSSPNPVAGAGGVIQSRFGSAGNGNFEVISDEHRDAVVHYWHPNSRISEWWIRTDCFDVLTPHPLMAERARKIAQLTGEFDRQGWNGTGAPNFAANRTESRFGIIGTELGSSLSIIQKSPIGWRVADVSDGHLAVSHDL